MRHVFNIGIIGRQVSAAAKPVSRAPFEVPKVRVDRGHERVGWMKHQRDSGRKKVSIFAAKASSNLPCTSEKFTPAFSNTAPFSITRVRPPPPSSRVHRSSRKRP